MVPILKLTKNIVSIFSAKTIEVFGRLIAIFIIARYLGVEDYGNYAFVNTFVMFFIICSNLGVTEIVTRQISISQKEIKKYMGGAISIRLIIVPAVLFLYAIIISLLKLPSRLVGAIYLALIGQIFVSFINLLLSFMRGLERMEYEPMPGIIYCFVFIPCVIFIREKDLGFIAIFQGNVLALAIAMCILIMLLRQKIGIKKIHWELKVGKMLILEGYALGISAILLMGSFYVDIFVLKFLKGAADVALFQLPYQLILRLSIVPVSLVTALFPTLSRLSSVTVTRNNSLVATIVQAYKILIAISALCIIYLVIYSGDIINGLAGSNFYSARYSLQILSWLILFSFTDFLQSIVLVAQKKQRWLIIQNASCLIINLILDLALVPLYGYIGACIATLISFAIRFGIGYYFVCKCIGVVSLPTICIKIGVSSTMSAIIITWLYVYNVLFAIIIGSVAYAAMLFGLRTITLRDIQQINENLQVNYNGQKTN